MVYILVYTFIALDDDYEEVNIIKTHGISVFLLEATVA